jgi:hypothetical protein
MAIMTIAGLASFREGTRIHTVESATERLRQLFSQAKVNAASGKKDCTTCGATGACGTGDLPLQGWSVNVDNTTSPVSATIQGLCGSNQYPSLPLPTPFLTKTELVPNGLTVTMLKGATNIGPTPILFRPFGGGVVPEVNSATVYTFNIADQWGHSDSFTIDGSGEVQ